jgi:hypothetical protein
VKTSNLTRLHRYLLRSVRRLPVTANVVPSSPILVTLIMEALRSSETSVLIRARRSNISEDVSLQIDIEPQPVVFHLV